MERHARTRSITTESRPPPDSEPGDRHFVTALARGLEVLACFRHGDRWLGNQELARRCGLAKSTISRLTHTLTRLGYLIHDQAQAKYGLGPAIISLGGAMLSRLDIRKLAHPKMQELAQFAQCWVSLGSRDRLSMISIDAVRGSAAVGFRLDAGSRIQLASSAMGRAYLAAVTQEERDQLMQRVREQEDVDVTRWLELRRGVTKALRDIRELGVCTSFGEWQQHINAIAIAVRPGGGLPPMAISCGAPAYMLSKEFMLDRVRPRLIALANELEDSLGTRT
jgi:DNA-binding IclR family transcriptional regulator